MYTSVTVLEYSLLYCPFHWKGGWSGCSCKVSIHSVYAATIKLFFTARVTVHAVIILPLKTSPGTGFEFGFLTTHRRLHETDGFQYECKRIFVKINGMFAARAVCLSTVAHNTAFGCSKCATQGIIVRTPMELRGRMSFPDKNASKRTDKAFRRRQRKEKA